MKDERKSELGRCLPCSRRLLLFLNVRSQLIVRRRHASKPGKIAFDFVAQPLWAFCCNLALCGRCQNVRMSVEKTPGRNTDE